MGSGEDMGSPKSEKTSPSRQGQSNNHLNPDWANIQAYYGHGIPLQPPYVNCAVMSGHGPYPHMWAPPQPMMSPYGVPYSTIYPPGVVYAHPAVPLVAAPIDAQPLNKLSDNIDHAPAKKVKGSDEVMQVANDHAEFDAEGSGHVASQSAEHGIDASSNGSDSNTPDERRLKRERRKQANRESARRSRLRKQSETEGLMKRYESLKIENMTLKSEINQLTEQSEKLRLENATLSGRLNGPEVEQPGETGLDKNGPDLAQSPCLDEGHKPNNSCSAARGTESITLKNSGSKRQLQVVVSRVDTAPTR